MSSNEERGPVVRPALSRLIEVTPEIFSRHYWGTGPLLSPGRDPGNEFADLFGLAAVDELVCSRGIRTPFARMANEGVLLQPDRYTSPGGFGAEVGDQIDSDKVLEEFATGSTLVLQGLHRTWAPIAEFTRRLVSEVGHPAQVNAYVTPASSRGFAPHYDVHDVFVIQIYGRKRWAIHPPVHPDPLRTQPWSEHADAVARQASGAPAIEETFRPGDVLYLPRGWIHSATALGCASIHLTIGVEAFTRWDIVEQVVARAVNDSRLRRSLPLGIDLNDDAALHSVVEETIAHLRGSLRSVESSSVSGSLARTLARAVRPEPVSPIATVESLDRMGPTTVVRWRRGLDARVESDADAVRIVLGHKTVSLPVEAERSIRALSTGGSARAGELEGLDPQSSVVVSRRLVREGVLILQ